MIIDTHCHLDMEQFNQDRENVIQRARDNGVSFILNIGCDVASSYRSLELAERYDFIYASAGIHPHDVEGLTEDDYVHLEKLHEHPKVIAVGETGLDYFKNYSPKEDQCKHFRRQAEMASKLGKPIVIHSREANDDIMSILSDYYPQNSKLSGIFHCFSGDKEMAEKALKMGFYISFAGPITFKRAEDLREVAKIIPPDRLFAETDSPYLTPSPNRGKRNEPSNVRFTTEKLAEVRGVTIEDIQRTIAQNFYELFGLGQSAEPGTISYRIRNSLYLNLTQRCTNSCVFCTRLTKPIVQGHNLALNREPSIEEIWQSIDDVKKYNEIVFCGYGEPTLRLDAVKKIAAKIKSAGGKTRLNTNGHGNVINKRNILPELKDLIDSVSVSLNADTSDSYDDVCVPLPSFRKGIYFKVKEFIEEAKKYIPHVQSTIVTQQKGINETNCEEISKKELGAEWRPRRYNMVG